MKAKAVLLSLLANQCLFIKAETAKNYYLFQKINMGPVFYKSHRFLSLNGNQLVIPVTITSFFDLPTDHQFASLKDALVPPGIIVPDDLQVKISQGFAGNLGAGYIKGHYGVADAMEVIDLQHIFIVRTVPMAFLNVG